MKFLQILVLIFGLVIFANAQKITLSGTVADKFGSLIPDAKVEIKESNRVTFSTQTDESGFYRFELEKGHFQIEVTKLPFQKYIGFDYLSANGQLQKQIKLDTAAEEINHEPCGYSGADCPKVLYCGGEKQEIIQTTENIFSNKISTRPLEKLPKSQNKNKGKSKNNKQ